MSCAVENDLRLIFVYQLLHYLGVTVSSVVFKKRILNHVNLFSSVLETFLSKVVYVISHQYCADLSIVADVLSQFFTLAQKFESYVLDLAVSLFCENPYMLISGKVNFLSFRSSFNSVEFTFSYAGVTVGALAFVDHGFSVFHLQRVKRTCLYAEGTSLTIIFYNLNSHCIVILLLRLRAYL